MLRTAVVGVLLAASAACVARADAVPEASRPSAPLAVRARRLDARASKLQLCGGSLGARERVLALRGGGRKRRAIEPIIAPVVASSDTSSADEYREAIKWTIITMTAAIAFGFGLIPFKGKHAAMDYFTGFLIEKILSVDNLFVFVMLFDYFKTPEEYQRKVLTIGIISAIVLRGIMISVGVQLVQRFRPVLLVFAGILVISSIKMAREALHVHRQGEAEEEEMDENAVVRLAGSLFPSTSRYDGSKFFTVKNGKRYATPMLMVLICIELSDVVFAVDSIPAIVGITKDTFVVFTSNIFAILGLRNLYVLLAKAVKDLVYLKASVAIILGFVGLKMVLEFTSVHISSVHSLIAVLSILSVGVGASLWESKRAAALEKESRRKLLGVF